MSAITEWEADAVRYFAPECETEDHGKPKYRRWREDGRDYRKANGTLNSASGIPNVVRTLYLRGGMIGAIARKLTLTVRKGVERWSVQRLVEKERSHHLAPWIADRAWYEGEEAHWKKEGGTMTGDEAEAFVVRMLGKEEGSRAIYGVRNMPARNVND